MLADVCRLFIAYSHNASAAEPCRHEQGHQAAIFAASIRWRLAGVSTDYTSSGSCRVSVLSFLVGRQQSVAHLCYVLMGENSFFQT